MIGSRKRPREEAKAAAAAAAAAEMKPKGTQPRRRHYGLYNQGSTCYLNSVLQVLFVTEEINDRLHPKLKGTDQELRNIFEKMKEATCRTENITRCLEIKNVNQQRDAAECLETILRKVSPQASEVLQGKLTYTTKCSRGHSINEETNPFWTLPLSLKDARDTTYSVEKNFERIFQTRALSGDNMVYCDGCKRETEATAGCEMAEPPQILTLLLKRFDFDHNTKSHVKSDCSNKTYKAYGIVNHMGGLKGGHYTATVLSNEDKTWYELNDADVNKIEEQPFEKNRTYNSRTAYLIMYRASGSLREKGTKQQDEHPEEERGHEQERKRRFGESDANGKENRQESVEEVREERSEEALSHRGRGEEGEAQREKRGSRFEKEEENVLIVDQRQNTSCSSKREPDDWTRAEKGEQRSKKGEESSLQPCKSSFDITKNPILIACVVLACMIIGVTLVVLLV